MQYSDTHRDYLTSDQLGLSSAAYTRIPKSVEPTAEIIGKSMLAENIKRLIGIISQSVSTVLILGETGTGKELIARAIHKASPRCYKPMIKVNCGALPVHLIESELFGHEKGSFTGAIQRRIGKFELAQGGTLFLDEVGEMPLELQVKLLRVLQEKELERLGGKCSIKVDVRIIAATNRDLEAEMQAGRFRPDLYYRLNVFPITVPALRERPNDIPLLAEHFLSRYSRNEKKEISHIPEIYLTSLLNYHWPGNIRELENIIARSVLLSSTSEFYGYPLPSNPPVYDKHSSAIKSIAQNEKEHILNTLKFCGDKIYGPGGAADILNINASTLVSRMKKLGIRRKFSI